MVDAFATVTPMFATNWTLTGIDFSAPASTTPAEINAKLVVPDSCRRDGVKAEKEDPFNANVSIETVLSPFARSIQRIESYAVHLIVAVLAELYSSLLDL